VEDDSAPEHAGDEELVELLFGGVFVRHAYGSAVCSSRAKARANESDLVCRGRVDSRTVLLVALYFFFPVFCT
jgi:hypothetical protein